jgi:4-amino-4-deoxy-L-arabinose transferase-like glycosyltransferase
VNPVPGERRWPLALLATLLASLGLSIFLAVSIPLVDPDEGRNAQVASEMLATGDWTVPHLAGMPYLDKPPALFWSAALSIHTFGRTRWAPRLPSIAAALATVLVLAALAHRVGGARLAWCAVALLASAPLFAALGAYAIFDMPLALCVTVVWTSLAREIAGGASESRRAAMFAALAMGVLVKGPVMLAWALGGSIGAALVSRSREPVRWLGWLPGWAIVTALAGGWFALACLRHPEYLRYALLEESLQRLVIGAPNRHQPWWFTPTTLIVSALPWSLATPWNAGRLRRAAGAGEPLGRAAAHVALGFVAFALVFFTLSRSKLITYLLPALPPLALLAALAWSTVRGRTRSALALVLLFTPALLAGGYWRLHRQAVSDSGEPLARAIQALGGAPAVRCERCYSPGTDYLLGRRSVIVTARAHQTTSTYQARYRDLLRRRGQWMAPEDVRDAPAADVIVQPMKEGGPGPPGYVEFFRDRRFVAYRRAALTAARPAPGLTGTREEW